LRDRGSPKIPVAILLLFTVLGSALVFLPVPTFASTIYMSPGCGATITKPSGTVIVLTKNIGPCSGNGLIIGHNGITLNCNGHTITGTSANIYAGIYLSGKTGVAVENCKVTRFRYGIELVSSSSNTLTTNTASGNHYDGFYLLGSSNSNKLTTNTANSNSHYGYDDTSTGSGTRWTANSYLDDECSGNGAGGSSPSGLGFPQS
jgi:parallel beta-helix repeat protein